MDHTYSLDAAALLLGVTLAELHGLVAAGVVDVVTAGGLRLPSGEPVVTDVRVPGWVLDELLDSFEYVASAIRDLP